MSFYPFAQFTILFAFLALVLALVLKLLLANHLISIWICGVLAMMLGGGLIKWLFPGSVRPGRRYPTPQIKRCRVGRSRRAA